MRGFSLWRAYAYAWITLGLFLFSLAGHWLFGWFAYVDEQKAHGRPVEVSGYSVEMARDTLENWQSEFLQPAVAGRWPGDVPLPGLSSIA